MQYSIIKNNLLSLRDSMALLSDEEFTQPIAALSEGTIGQHVRHIIELFQCLASGYHAGVINYDDRVRSQLIQTNRRHAMQCITDLMGALHQKDKKLYLHSLIVEESQPLHTTYFRELLYNFEHCVHHQALIKVGFIALDKSITNEFGVALSTLQYKKVCAQ